MEKKRSVGVIVFGRIIFVYSIFLLINWFLGLFETLLFFSPYPYDFLIMPLIIRRIPIFYVKFLSGLFSFLIWAIYLISSIGILRLKNWSRLLSIYFSGFIALFGIPPICDLVTRPVVFWPGNFFYWSGLSGFASLNKTPGIILALTLSFYPVVLALLFIFFFTRPKVKEQFKKEEIPNA